VKSEATAIVLRKENEVSAVFLDILKHCYNNFFNNKRILAIKKSLGSSQFI